jgi:uncharacterized protein (TIGR01619 family)
MNTDYKPDWDLYSCNIDDKPAVIGLDLALRNLAPIAHQPVSIYVAVKLQNPREDGFPDQEEFAVIGQLEDALVHQMEEKLKATFAGRTVSDGVRDFYFYAADSQGYEQIVSDVMEQYPGYKYRRSVAEDKTWDRYLDFLFPVPQEFQRIQNRKVLRVLQRHGDIGEKQRQIDHWINFSSEAERAAYLQEVEARGFKLEALNIHEQSAHPYSLQVSRTDAADPDSIDNNVLWLWDLARQHGGNYDGWETFIVTE